MDKLYWVHAHKKNPEEDFFAICCGKSIFEEEKERLEKEGFTIKWSYHAFGGFLTDSFREPEEFGNFKYVE